MLDCCRAAALIMKHKQPDNLLLTLIVPTAVTMTLLKCWQHAKSHAAKETRRDQLSTC